MKSIDDIIDSYGFKGTDYERIVIRTIARDYAKKFASQPPAHGGYSLQEAEDKAIDDIPMYPIQKIPDNWAGHIHALRKVYASGLVASRNLPPSGNLWEEVDAVKEPPGEDGEYFILVKNQVCREFNTVAFMEDKVWRIPSNYTVISYLRPVTGQRYSEDIVWSIATISIMAATKELSKNNVVDVDAGIAAAKQFIQSLNKK